jgi:hypothetical protein
MCFGSEGEWLDVPHEKIKDICSKELLTCFIKSDDTLACIGAPINLLTFTIKAQEIVFYGIDPVTGDMVQDYSHKKFKNVKIGDTRVCAQGLEDGIVYCMGTNLHGAGQSSPEEAVDYHPHYPKTMILIPKDGTLKVIGSAILFSPLKNISDPQSLKYQRLASDNETAFFTAAGNTYDDGSSIPENTLVTTSGFVREGVMEFVYSESSYDASRFGVFCFTDTNHKVKCEAINDFRKREHTKLISDIPKEIDQ